MAQLIVQVVGSNREEACVLCRWSSVQKPGPQLCIAVSRAAVCHDCGRRYTPVLGSLLELAEVAEKVGRVSGRRRRWVPLTLLLELARAAETYSSLAVVGRSMG